MTPADSKTSLQETEILVVGAGPAGSTAAALLARRGRRVTLVDKSRHPRFHIGESLLPMSMPLLRALGVLGEIERIGVIKRAADFPSPCPEGYQAFRFARSLNPTWDHALQVQRSAFDAALLDNARRAGAQVIEECEITGVAFDDDVVCASTRSRTGAAGTIRARYVVDASGRDTLLGRRFGLKQRDPAHQSAALYAHFRGVARRTGEDAGNISIYRVDDGWIWLIPLPDDVTSIGLVCGPDTLRGRAGDSTGFLWRSLRAVPGLAERLENASLLGHLEATGNYSYRCRRLAGRGWIMVGDAGGFVDPIFSSGVHMALHGAFRAAQLVDTVLDDPGAEASLQRAYTREQRDGLRTVSWFIRRFNTPVMRRLFAQPRNDWRIEEAIISMLAGDFYRDGGVRWRLRAFKCIYALSCLFDISAAWRGVRQAWSRRREVFLADTADTLQP